MMRIALAVGALFIGPTLGHLIARFPDGRRFLEGFVTAGMALLCCFQVLPEALELSGLPALAPLIAGLLIPTALERFLIGSIRSAHLFALLLAASGLLLHEFMDGAALAGFEGHHELGPDLEASIATGIFIHRVPMGLLIWWAIGSRFGYRIAVGVLSAMAFSTIAGCILGGPWIQALHGELVGYVLALLVGSLLHVVLHQSTHSHDPEPERESFLAGAGALAAVVLLGVMVVTTSSLAAPVARTFGELFHETAPALVIGFLAAGAIHGFVPLGSLEAIGRGSTAKASFQGMLIGLPLAVCSCGVVPIYESLVKRGLPTAAGISFLVSTPELGVDALLITLPLLGWKMTVVRLVAAVMVAFLVSYVMGSLFPSRPSTEAAGASPLTPPPPSGLGERLSRTWRYGLMETVDQTGPWILLGLMIAAIAQPCLDLAGVASLSPNVQVVLMTLVAMPIYVCASGATPIAALLIAKGVTPGAALAFLLAGPATNPTTFGVLSRLHGRGFAGLFALVVTLLCVGTGLAVDRFGGGLVEAAGRSAHHHGTLGLLSTIATTLLALLFAFSLLRQGPAGFLKHLMRESTHDHEDHGHREEEEDPHGCCDHDH